MQHIPEHQHQSARTSYRTSGSSSGQYILRRLKGLGARLLLTLGFVASATGAFADDNVYWDSQFACPGGNGLDTTVTQVAAHNGTVYAVGDFTRAGRSRVRNAAQWTGTGWAPLGTGPGYAPCHLCIVGNNICTADRKRVDTWNGTGWSKLLQLPDDLISDTSLGQIREYYRISSLGTNGNALCAAEVTDSLHHEWHNYSEWNWVDIYQWHLGPSGLTSSGNFDLIAQPFPYANYVSAIVGDSTRWYFGGSFVLSSWIGLICNPTSPANIYAMFLGRDGYGISALTLDRDTLYAGIYSSSAAYVTMWDGSSWSILGTVNGYVQSIAVFGNDRYVAGEFTTAGGVSANRIAHWDGSSWSNLGSGLNGKVLSLAMIGRAVIAGGEFTTAGGKASNHLAIWRPRVNVSTATLSANPGPTTLGNDPYGYYKPALMTGTGTSVSYADVLPTTFTLDQAEITTVGGQRVNGAFTLSPEGVKFGGDGAVLHIEFSEDDVKAFGATYTDFRAVRLGRPGSDAPPVMLLAPDVAVPVRTQDGKQIYAITIALTEIRGVYGAVPLSTITPYGLSLSAVPAEGGIISADQPAAANGYACGTVLTLTAKSAPGYRFDSWGGALTGTTNPAVVTVADDTSICANFLPGSIDAPNLTGTWSSLKVTGSTRQTLNATFSAANSGTQVADKYRVQFYLSATDVCTSDSVLVKTCIVRRHEIGRVESIRIAYKARPGMNLSGMRLIAVVDADGSVKEQSELDNTIASAPLP